MGYLKGTLVVNYVSFETPKISSGVEVPPYLSLLLDEVKPKEELYIEELPADRKTDLVKTFFDYYSDLGVLTKRKNGSYSVVPEQVLFLSSMEAEMFSKVEVFDEGFSGIETVYKPGTKGYEEFDRRLNFVGKLILGYAKSLGVLESKWITSKFERIYYPIVAGLALTGLIGLISSLETMPFLFAFLAAFAQVVGAGSVVFYFLEGKRLLTTRLTDEGQRIFPELKQYYRVWSAKKVGAAYIN